MTKKWEELTEEFDAVSQDGQKFHLLVFTEMIDTTSVSNPKSPPVIGLKRIITSDEQICNRIDDETFKIVELDIQVKRL